MEVVKMENSKYMCPECKTILIKLTKLANRLYGCPKCKKYVRKIVQFTQDDVMNKTDDSDE